MSIYAPIEESIFIRLHNKYTIQYKYVVQINLGTTFNAPSKLMYQNQTR